ncbi:MAG: glycoside hydrolase family 127 protein [Agriterribacter sp.]
MKSDLFSLKRITKGVSLYLFITIGCVPAFSQTNHAFVQEKYKELPLGSIQPKGWLLHQLQIMRDGTTGHLDEVYAKVKNNNGWLGGKGDGWEETPYWLDGAVPLAYLLNDAVLKERVLKYINWTITNQRPSGYFGPITAWERETGKKITVNDCDKGEDWWPKMVMLKVLQQYYTATNDARVIKFMQAYFNYQQQAIKTCAIGKWTEWATSRGADNVLVIQWLYNITKDKSLLSLAAAIQSQSFEWSTWLGNRDWVINAAAYQNEKKWMTRHGVNVAMGLKDPAVQYQRTGNASYLKAMKTGFHDLMTLHGLPMGVFSADEDLHGNAPTQGTELCAIVEGMFSLEQTIGITGDPTYMDALERMTFNALPAQTTDDYNNKQYFQIANQVHIKRGVFNFSLPFGREMNNVLGMRSGYTCCLANMHQGWTKFTSHLWYSAPGNGIAALHYSPSIVTSKVGSSNTTVTINEETAYPFDDAINFTMAAKQAVRFPFVLRIPAWCNEATILLNGKKLRTEKGGQLITIDRVWQHNDKITLQLPMHVSISEWGRNSRAVERGPLVYALKLPERWEKDSIPEEGDYFNVFTDAPWNYGIEEAVVQKPAEQSEVKLIQSVDGSFVWNLAHAPVEITVGAKKIPDWKIVNDVAPQPVTARDGLYMGKVDTLSEKITLIPYGCTKVRIVAFPVIK